MLYTTYDILYIINVMLYSIYTLLIHKGKAVGARRPGNSFRVFSRPLGKSAIVSVQVILQLM